MKRGLVAHRQAGYPLRPGGPFRLVADDGFRDARGIPLRAAAEWRYEVGGDERRHVEPADWTLRVPPCHTVDPLDVAFARPLDHGLLTRCLHVVGPDGHLVDGAPQIGIEERSWRLVPSESWVPGSHQLVIDHVLEDLADNSVRGVFD